MSGNDGIWIKDSNPVNDDCKLIKTETLYANNPNDVVQGDSIRKEGWKSYPNNPTKLSQTSIGQLVNPISFNSSIFKLIIFYFYYFLLW